MTAKPHAVRWAALPSHRAWLRSECNRLLDFARSSADPADPVRGFGWLDDTGRLRPAVPVQTWITCRMTHVFALGHLLGRPGDGPYVDLGVAALNGRLRDPTHGGWFTAEGDSPATAEKRAYDHAFVVLAGSSGAVAGRPGAEDLLSQALEVLEQRFWREDDGLVVDVWDASWEHLEPYRGANANMHTVEAFLAAADVTGDGVWRQRALRIVERVVHGFARSNDWRLPEHFDESWRACRDYNSDDRAHPFRPYGVTIGHLFEWSRLALHVHAALGPGAPGWLVQDARALFAVAVGEGWFVDGAEGFVYTTDWDGTPVVRDRLHWVVTEAIAAAAALGQATGDSEYEGWYRRWWDHAATYFLDTDLGSWRHELDPANHPAATVWQGKPDVYHAVQATLLPQLPLSLSLATALTRMGS